MTQEIQDKIEAAKAPFVASVEAMDAIPALVDAHVKEVGDLRFAEGQASIILPQPGTGELVYTQEDADRLADQVRLENDAEVAELKASVESKDVTLAEMSAKIAELEAAQVPVAEELAALKAAVLVEIEDSKVDTARMEAALGSVSFK